MFNYSIFKNLRQIIYSRLISFCDFHNIISSSQFGFRKGLSILHAIETLQKVIINTVLAYLLI